MTYTWKVRVSDAATYVDLNHSSWSPWAERHFRTPAVSSTTITPLTPSQGDVVSTLTPIVQWDNTRGDVFYYEMQLSKDPALNTDPATATAMVYSSLLHGGVTSPWNSYAVPPSFPLENNTTYYWRVRPRVQGDGTPLAWSATYSFQANTGASPALRAEPFSFGLSAADSTTCQIAGAATSFASTPTLTGVYYAFKFTGSGSISISPYRDVAPQPSGLLFQEQEAASKTPIVRLGAAPMQARRCRQRPGVWRSGTQERSCKLPALP